MTHEDEKRLYVQLRVALNEISQRLGDIAQTISSLPPRRGRHPDLGVVTSNTALFELCDAKTCLKIVIAQLQILQPDGGAK